MTDQRVPNPGSDEVETVEGNIASIIVSLPVEYAEYVCALMNKTLRIVCLDGLDAIVTTDYRPDRCNVAVVNGIVTEVISWG